MFRCPTCVSVLGDAEARRCPMCGANLRRHPPEVLGQSARVTARLQPIDLRPAATYGGSARSDIDIALAAAWLADVREPEVAGAEIEHSAVKGAA